MRPPPIAGELEGKFRPDFFDGVATVVLKLFNCVQPLAAVFGKKDYQQLMIVRGMVRSLDLPLAIVAGETVREPDGLAMSSRNGYLSAAERAEAPRLYRVLQKVCEGMAPAEGMRELARSGWQADYLDVRRRSDLAPAQADDGERVVLGTRVPPYRVTTSQGKDITSLVNGSGMGYFAGGPGDTVLIELVKPGAPGALEQAGRPRCSRSPPGPASLRPSAGRSETRPTCRRSRTCGPLAAGI